MTQRNSLARGLRPIAFAALVLALGCAAGPPTREVFCLELAAGNDLNFFSNQPHVVRLHLFPLETRIGFDEAKFESLLAGMRPAGQVGDRLEFRIAPGETRSLEETLDARVRFVGVAADYYLEAGERPTRTAVLEASCSRRPAKLLLGAKELAVE